MTVLQHDDNKAFSLVTIIALQLFLLSKYLLSSDTVIEDKFIQQPKGFTPMISTDEGIVTLAKLMHKRNASSSISTTEFGMKIDSIEQCSNELAPLF